MGEPYQTIAAAYLRRVSDERGLTQAELARVAKVTQTTIQRALKDDYRFKLKLQTLTSIATATGIPLPESLFASLQREHVDLPDTLRPEFVSRFLQYLIAELVGDEFANAYSARIARAAKLIAHQASKMAAVATEEERLTLLDQSLRGGAEKILASAPSPGYDSARLHAGVRLFPEWWRALERQAD